MIIFILIHMSFFEVKRSWNVLSTYLLNGWWDDCGIFCRAATNKSQGKEQSRSQNVQNINIQKFQNVKLLKCLEWVVLCWLLSISSALFPATPSFIWFANSITCSLLQPCNPSDLLCLSAPFHPSVSTESPRNRGISCVNLIHVYCLFSLLNSEEKYYESK